MKLVAISPNILVNPDHISRVEQKKVKNVLMTCVYIDGKEIVLSVPIGEFYKSLGFAEQSSGGQHFAG